MESYLKSWEDITKEYQHFSQRSSYEHEMMNSLKTEDDKEKIGCDDSHSDSLPIHCIVQTFSSLKDLKSPYCQNCEDENVSVDCWWKCECKKNEMTGCVVVPEDTPMNDLVRTALVKLGYPASASLFATGSILIRNWKPLPLEAICVDLKKPVIDILGEITAVVSLRIQIFRPKITATQQMKDNLLLFLIKANQNFLRDSHCPFDASVLSKFCDQSAYMKMHRFQDMPEDLQRKFDAWLEHVQEMEKSTAAVRKATQFSHSFFVQNNNKNGDVSKEKVEPNTQETNGKELKMPAEKENLNMAKEPSFSMTERPQQLCIPKSRVRTSFDPEFELPKLQKWYLKNPHPSKQQIYIYVAELNSLESRKGRKQLDVNNVVYWFKNTRAAQKRTECRRFTKTSSTEPNRGNVLKIPLGKNCGVSSDNQKSNSNDEAPPVILESSDECSQEKGRCLQVVGKWNSNGQGEAVLEMQIPSLKNEFPQSLVQAMKDKNEEDENSGSVDEDSNDSVRMNPQNKDFYSGTTEKTQRENQKADSEQKSPIKYNDVPVKEQYQSIEDREKSDNSSSKVPAPSSFISYKEKSDIGNGEFMSPYKSGFSAPPNSVLNPSFMCMAQSISPKPSSLPLSSEERRKRNRTFIDPVTEVPRLEQWFRLSTHPSHSLIARFTEELNNMPYRRKFPKLEVKNVQFWFKNRRAKNKRLNYLENSNN